MISASILLYVSKFLYYCDIFILKQLSMKNVFILLLLHCYIVLYYKAGVESFA